MRTRKRKNPVLLLCAVIMIATLMFYFAAGSGHLKSDGGFLQNAAVLSAMLTIPEGGRIAAENLAAPDAPGSAGTDAAEYPASSTPPEDSAESPLNPSPEKSTEIASSFESLPPIKAPSLPKTPPEGVETGSVVTQFLDPKTAGLKWENIYINNRTAENTVDIAREIEILPNVKIKKDGTPQVLIIHTHATEKYLDGDVGYYIKGAASHTTDNTKNVVRVGAEIKKQLDAAGIVTVQDTTQHDYPSYGGSYERSAETIKKYLDKYPSIQVVLDVHRDAITKDGGVKTKPTAEINGKKAAQIMICAGCQEGAVSGFENWMENMRLALRLQRQCETDYPGLNRSIYFIGKKYNEYLLPGSLLIEMGSEANTLEEASYSGELLGKALVEVLEALTV